MLSPTCSSPLSNRTLFLWREAAHTMIRLSPRSLNPHCCAICKIPSGSGFGRRFGVSLVMIGSKTYDGRWFFKRCVTGALNQQRHQPGLLKRGTRRRGNLLKVPRTQCAPHPPPLKIIYQLHESRLRLLREHCLPLDGLDLFHGGGLLLGRGKAADVFEDVG